MKTLDERLRFGIIGRVQSLVRVTVARQKSLQPKHVSVLRQSDDDRSSGANFEKPHATQDERAHDALSKFRFGHQQRTKAFRLDDEGLYRR